MMYTCCCGSIQSGALTDLNTSKRFCIVALSRSQISTKVLQFIENKNDLSSKWESCFFLLGERLGGEKLMRIEVIGKRNVVALEAAHPAVNQTLPVSQGAQRTTVTDKSSNQQAVAEQFCRFQLEAAHFQFQTACAAREQIKVAWAENSCIMNCTASDLCSSFCRLAKSAVIFSRCVWISSDCFDAMCTSSSIFNFCATKLRCFSSICLMLSSNCSDFFLDCTEINMLHS